MDRTAREQPADQREPLEGSGKAMKAVTEFLVLSLKSSMALLLLFMALLTGADVIGRYGFNRPISGTDEMIAASMALLIFGSLPLVTLQNGQITVDIGAGLLRGGAKRVQYVLVNIFGTVVLGFLALQLWRLAGKAMHNSDYSSMLHIPFGPIIYMMATMSALTCWISLCLAVLPPRAQAVPPA